MRLNEQPRVFQMKRSQTSVLSFIAAVGLSLAALPAPEAAARPHQVDGDVRLVHAEDVLRMHRRQLEHLASGFLLRDNERMNDRVEVVALGPGGRFVFGDVVIPTDPKNAVIEIEEGYDFPSTVEDQLGWLAEAGFTPEVVWLNRDLAVLRADRD